MAFVERPGVPAKPQTKKYGPRFSSPVNSPAWEWTDDTQFLEVTRGCSHNSCLFCTFFKNIPYDKVPLDEVEHYIEYLELCDKRTPVHRVFLQGSNPFHLSYDELMEIGELLHKHLPNLMSIGGYGRMSDLRDKSVEQLRSLHQAGFASFYFGVESADDVVLKRVNKGYDSAELYEAGMKLKESGMPWTCAIMLGLGGHDYGLDHAIKTAEFFTATEPTIIGCVSLTLVYDHYTCMEPPLKKLVEAGKFVEAGEIERYKELRAFIDHLDARTFFTCQHSTMPVGFSAVLPDQKKDLLASIDAVIEEGDEAGMAWFRDRVKEV